MPSHTAKHIPMKKSGRACLFSVAFLPTRKKLIFSETAVLRLKFCAKIPPLRQAANRWQQLYNQQYDNH